MVCLYAATTRKCDIVLDYTSNTGHDLHVNNGRQPRPHPQDRKLSTDPNSPPRPKDLERESLDDNLAFQEAKMMNSSFRRRFEEVHFDLGPCSGKEPPNRR